MCSDFSSPQGSEANKGKQSCRFAEADSSLVPSVICFKERTVLESSMSDLAHSTNRRN